MGKSKDAERIYLSYLDAKEKELQDEMNELINKREKYLLAEKGLERYKVLLDEELNMSMKISPTLHEVARAYPLLHVFEDIAVSVGVENNAIFINLELLTFVFPESRSCNDKNKPKVLVVNNKFKDDAVVDEETFDKISGLLETEYFKKRMDKIYELGFEVELINCFPE